jgi:hypothetical protein
MLANGTIKTIDDEEDIYVSLTALCEYFAQSVKNMKSEIESAPTEHKRYAIGLLDMMTTIAEETIELGKYEAQRRMINTPEDLFRISDLHKNKPE